MKKEIANLANYLNVKQDISFTEASLRENIPTFFQTLLDTGILAPTKPADSVRCKDCDLDHLERVVEINGKYFTKCEYSEYASLSEVRPEELNSYRFSLNNFLSWIAEVVAQKIEVKPLNERTWLLGKRLEQSLYFIRSQDYAETQNEARKINTENNLFIWLGVKPLTGYSTIELISIQDIIKHGKNGLEIQQPKNKPKRAKPNTKDITLDNDIVITNDCYLLLWLENGAFNHKLKINQKTYTIVRYLFDQRKYSKAYKSTELSENLHFTNSKAIPTRIRELNKICDEYRVKRIVVGYPNKTWTLNPDLTCFN